MPANAVPARPSFRFFFKFLFFIFFLTLVGGTGIEPATYCVSSNCFPAELSARYINIQLKHYTNNKNGIYIALIFLCFKLLELELMPLIRDLAVISNNIANAGTNGFKRSEAQFEDVFMNHHDISTTKAKGLGVKTIKPRQNFSQGSLQQTNGSLDLAIMGEGFFVFR